MHVWLLQYLRCNSNFNVINSRPQSENVFFIQHIEGRLATSSEQVYCVKGLGFMTVRTLFLRLLTIP